MRVSDKALGQAIAFFAVVAFFLGKKALVTEGDDPVLRAVRKAA